MAISKKLIDQALETWIGLNEVLMTTKEEDAQALLDAETAGRNRRMFTLRIHSRLNKLRAQRERKELTNGK